MSHGSAPKEYDGQRLGDEIIVLFGLGLKRRTIAFGVASILIILGFILLFTGYLEGRAFVSMLTLALGSGLLVLVWDRVEKLTLFGNEIKLRRLARDAENLLQGLETGRSDLYSTALRVAMRTSQGTGSANTISDERNADVLHVLNQIERAGIFDNMSDEIFCATSTLIASTTCNIRTQKTSLSGLINEDEQSNPEELTAHYDRWREKRQGEELSIDDAIALEHAIDELKALQRYRRLAMQ